MEAGVTIDDTFMAEPEGSGTLVFGNENGAGSPREPLAATCRSGCREFPTGGVTPSVEPRTPGVHAHTQLGTSPESGATEHRV